MIGTDFPYQQFYPKDATSFKSISAESKSAAAQKKSTTPMWETRSQQSAHSCPSSPTMHSTSTSRPRSNTIEKRRKGLDELAIGGPGKKPIHPHMSPEFSTNSPPRTPSFPAMSDPDDLDRALSDDERQPPHPRLLQSRFHGERSASGQSAQQVTHPGRQVISLSGDGGLRHAPGRSALARQLKLPVKVICLQKTTPWRLWN